MCKWRDSRRPVLERVALAHDDGDVADALGKPRMRRAGPEPALLEGGARHDIGAASSQSCAFALKRLRRAHGSTRRARLRGKRSIDASDGGARRFLRRDVDEAVVRSHYDRRMGALPSRPQADAPSIFSNSANACALSAPKRCEIMS